MAKPRITVRKVGRGYVVMMGRIPVETSTNKTGAKMMAKKLSRRR